MPRPKHTHQYHRIYPHGISGQYMSKMSGVWACALPDCTHFMPHNVAAQVEGKLSLCNECMDPFILDEENMKLDKPLCTKCLNPSAVIEVPDDIDWEREETRSYIATSRNVAPSEVTEEEIDKILTLRAFSRNKT